MRDYELTKKYPIGAPALAYGCVLGYFSIETFSFAMFPGSSSGNLANLDSFLFWSTFFTAVFTLSGALLGGFLDRIARGVPALVAAAVLLACCPCLSLAVGAGLLPNAVLLAGGAIFGAGSALFRLAFVRSCVTMRTADVLATLCFANVIGGFIYFMAISVPPAMGVTVMVLIPFVAAACFVLAKDRSLNGESDGAATPAESHVRAQRQAIVALLVATPLILIASTTARLSLYASPDPVDLAAQWQETVFWMVCISAALAFLAISPAFEKGQVLPRFFCMALLVVLLFFFVAPFIDYPLPSAAAICGALGNMMDLVITMICIQIIKQWRRPVVRTFSLVVGSACLGRFCSHALFVTEVQHLTIFGIPSAFLVDFLIIVAVVGLLTSKEFPELLSDAPAGSEGGLAAGAQPFVQARTPTQVRAAFADAALTPKQMEVAELLLKGHTIRMMAEELCCSESTVKAHVHQIYLKTGVESREGLMRAYTGEGEGF